MAKTATATNQTSNQPLDVVPGPVEDRVDPVAEAVPSPSPDAVPLPEKPKFETYEDPREAIAARREQHLERLLDAGAFELGETTPTEQELAATEAEPAALQRAEAAAVAQPTDDPLIDLIVDGQKKTMPLSEVRARAQKDLAADNRLTELNRRLDEVNARLAQGPDQTNVRQPTEPPAGRPDPRRVETNYDAAQLLDTVERLQTGSREDGAEVLAALLNDTLAKATPVEAVRGEITNALNRERETRMAEDALVHFAEQYQAVASSDDLLNIAFVHTVNEICDDFAKAGMKPADVAFMRQNPEVTRKTYQAYKGMRNGDGTPMYPLRSYEEVLTAAGNRTLAGMKSIAEQLGYVAPTAASAAKAPNVRVSQDRQARREGIVEQPRATASAGSAKRLGTTQRAVSEADSRRQGFEDLRRSRLVRPQ